jgi:hypothetical protein
VPHCRIDSCSPPDWSPLERVAEVCRVGAGLPPLDPADFLYMACAVTAGGLRVHLYKNRYSRRYLNLDEAGHAYRYVVERRRNRPVTTARYEPLPDLRGALRRAVGQLPVALRAAPPSPARPSRSAPAPAPP